MSLRTPLLLCLAILSLGRPQANDLEILLIGNAGVMLSDGRTSLLIDLPYEPGAFGYMRYGFESLDPEGSVVSVITHHHRDHFDPGLFAARPRWRIIGPASVVDVLPEARVIPGDSVDFGAFTIIALPSPHTDDHRSYRIRWNDRVLHFVGDTEDVESLSESARLDVLFITPWLSCSLARGGRTPPALRSIAYHLQPDGSDELCGPVERSEQGMTFSLPPRD